MRAQAILVARLIGLSAVLCVAGMKATAQTFVYLTSDNEIISGTENSGFWRSSNVNFDFVSSYFASEHYGLSGTFRDFFSFRLDGLSGTVVSATLHLKTFYISPDGGALGLWDVSTSADDLRHQAPGRIDAVIADLGSGTSYGTFGLAQSQSDGTVDFNLNAAALADIQAHAGSWFSIGGAFQPVMTDGYAFNTSGNSGGENRLIVTTQAPGGDPAPVSGGETALIGLALTGLACLRRRYLGH